MRSRTLPWKRQSLPAILDAAVPPLIFIAAFAGLSIWVPFFFSWVNLVGLALSVSMIGIGASSMMFCLAAGNVDISIESVVAVSGVCAAVLVNETHSIAAGIAGGIAMGALVGLANGVVVARFRVNALIATLAMQQIVRGVGFIISGSSAVGISDRDFFDLGNGALLGMPTPVWITVFCFVLSGLLLNKTTFGKETLALGGSREAARLAGVSVMRVEMAGFLLNGMAGGLAGVVLASRMTSGQPNVATGFSMDCLSACVLGGVSLNGGVARVSGAIVGVLVMGTMQNAMNLLNVPNFYQYIARGSILLAAVLFDQTRRSRREGALGGV
jgi:L-arabinose transport system permease protein